MSAIIDQDEREQFSATIARMNAETRKFVAEHDKLYAEAAKFDRDCWLAPATAVIALLAALACLASAYVAHSR